MNLVPLPNQVKPGHSIRLHVTTTRRFELPSPDFRDPVSVQFLTTFHPSAGSKLSQSQLPLKIRLEYIV